MNPLRYKVFRDNYSQLGRMDLVSKPQSSAPLWEHFGFKPNERGETINVNEPVCRLCLKTVATKRGNTTNLKSHLKHNHPTQFFNLGTTTAAGGGLPDSYLLQMPFPDSVNINVTARNGAHSQIA